MSATLLLALIAVAPAALALFFRSNAAVVFFALCSGSVLERYAGSSANDLASGLNSAQIDKNNIVHIGLLVLPALVALLLLRKSISTTKLLLNVIASAALGLVMVLLVVPLLPDSVRGNITSTSIWGQLNSNSAFLIAVSTGVALVVLALTYKMPKDHHKKHK